MGFVAPRETYDGRITEITAGAAGEAVFGGEEVLPFHLFEGKMPRSPVIAFEIQDVPPHDWPDEVRRFYEGVGDDPARWARFCVDEFGARMIALRLSGTHPDGEDRSPAEAAQSVSSVLSAVEVPLIILGSNHIEKDGPVLVAASEAAQGRNCIIGKAQENNYKTVTAAAMAHSHKLIAMAELDINLSKQLNILITQMGFDRRRIIIDPMCAALGYGIEYTYSVMERIRLAALTQNDEVMQQPILGDIGFYTWKVKEAQAPEADIPQWGDLAKRGVAWESVTAGTLLLSGADLLIMRNPDSVRAVSRFIDELMGQGE